MTKRARSKALKSVVTDTIIMYNQCKVIYNKEKQCLKMFEKTKKYKYYCSAGYAIHEIHAFLVSYD